MKCFSQMKNVPRGMFSIRENQAYKMFSIREKRSMKYFFSEKAFNTPKTRDGKKTYVGEQKKPKKNPRL